MSNSQEPVDLRVRRTHKLLWEALVGLMAEQDFDAISVKDICKRAMVHRTTFYLHYEDKYDLLSCGLQEVHQRTLAEIDLVSQDSAAYSLFFMHVAAHERFYRQMLCGKGNDLFQRWLCDYFAERISAKLQLLQNTGQTFFVPLPLLAQFYAGALVSTLAWWLSNGLPASAEQLTCYVKSLLPETLSDQKRAR